MREVVLTGLGCAGPWGVAATVPRDPLRGLAPVAVRAPLRVPRAIPAYPPHRAVVEADPPGLNPRQRRYLGLGSRLAIAACSRALAEAGLAAEPSAREPLACVVANPRGPTDPETTAAIGAAARAAAAKRDGRPLARAALETYTRRRPVVQYLLSMEPAVVGQLTAALGARGPAHAVTTPGLAGGAQALVRAARLVARGDAPAALACGVLTAEDVPGLAAWLDVLGAAPDNAVVECAAAVLLEDAAAVAAGGRTARARLRVVAETFEAGGPAAAASSDEDGTGGVVLDETAGRKPHAGAALALLELGGLADSSLPCASVWRGALGHRYRIELLPPGGASP